MGQIHFLLMVKVGLSFWISTNHLKTPRQLTADMLSSANNISKTLQFYFFNLKKLILILAIIWNRNMAHKFKERQKMNLIENFTSHRKVPPYH